MRKSGSPIIRRLYLAETWCASASAALRAYRRREARQCIAEAEKHLARAKELLGE